MPKTFEKFYKNWRHQQDMLWTLTKAFILGCGKSGTTWMMNLLNGHHQIAIRGEGCFTYQLAPVLQQAFQHFNKHQQQYEKSPCTHLQQMDQAFITRTAIDALLAHYVQDAKCDLTQLSVIGDKTPQHAVALEALSQLYPEARFIHIVRDPRDVAVSAWFHQGRGGERTFEQFITYFMNTVWPLHVGNAKKTSTKLGDRYFEVRYEDLHQHEFQIVKRLLDFLGVDTSDTAVQSCIQNGSFQKNANGRSRGQEDTNAFLRKGIAGDWVNHIPYELAQSCCDQIADLMTAFDYSPSCKDAVERKNAPTDALQKK